MVCTTRISPMTVITVVEVVGSHPQGTNFGRMSCAQAYIRFAGKRTVRIAGDDNEFQARIQVVGQLG